MDDLGRARVELLRGQIAFASGAGGDKAPVLLLKAARQLEALDPALACETYLDAWSAAYFVGQFARDANVSKVSRAAISTPSPRSGSRPSGLLLDGLSVLVSDGRTAAASKLSRAVSVFAQGQIDVAEGLRWGWLATFAACTLWDEEDWYAINDRQLHSVRDAGLLFNLPMYIHSLGSNLIWRGDFAAAASLIAEADTVAEATGTRFARATAMTLECFRGREAKASALIEVNANHASVAGLGVAIQICQWVSAVLNNGLGRYEQALAGAQAASEEAPALFVSGWALVELIEAAARTGRTRIAGEALERLAEAARAGGTDWGLGVLARSRALLGEGADAEQSYREAIERLSRTRLAPDLARVHLVYGEWLRRGNRRVDARAQLRIAHEMFTSIGMEAFAERARTELRATAEHVRARAPEARDDLTAQERKIAELARDGFSNPEIGARLFLSPRTVEWHLRHVFTKLGIKSRRELANSLPISSSETVSA